MQAITLFVQSLKSPYTQKTYLYHLNKFCAATKMDYDKLLHESPKDLEMKIIEYLVELKTNGKSYLTRQLALAAIKHFLAINDVVINGAKVSRFLGEKGKTVKDRAYTDKEIAVMLTKCDERKKVILLLLASSGMRIGALVGLKLKHIVKLQSGIYKVLAYYGTNDEYVTFCSYECTLAIDSYLEFRQRYGEKLTPESPIIRDQFDRNDPFHSAKARPIMINTLDRKSVV